MMLVLLVMFATFVFSFSMEFLFKLPEYTGLALGLIIAPLLSSAL